MSLVDVSIHLKCMLTFIAESCYNVKTRELLDRENAYKVEVETKRENAWDCEWLQNK